MNRNDDEPESIERRSCQEPPAAGRRRCAKLALMSW